MKRTIITTADGSKTIQLEEWQEQYHSKHGAIQEAYHVFLEHGLLALELPHIAILEMGFGTGLNALVTFLVAQEKNLTIDYTGVEAFPVSPEEQEQLNYVATLGKPHLQAVFDSIHGVSWEERHSLSPKFHLYKQQKDFFEVTASAEYHLIYFDAFGPRVQPELWTTPMFENMFRALKSQGVLVTYSAKGSVRRNLQEVGFAVERLPGPPGKREMLRAKKP